MSDQQGRKRKKNYYIQNAKKAKQGRSLEVGMKGFLLTCNNREKECVREAYNLLNEYADRIYGPQKTEEKSAGDNAESDEEEDIEAALKKEVSELQTNNKSTEYRFKNTFSGAKNCVFIRTTLEKPTDLVQTIFKDVYESGQSKARYIMRFLPVSVTCKPNEECIKKAFLSIASEYFKDTHTYCVLFKARNNGTIGKDAVTKTISETVKDFDPCNSVNFNEPELVINVDVIKTVCCISILENYYRWRKYNIHEAASAKEGNKSPEKSKEGSTEVQFANAEDRKDNGEEAVTETVTDLATKLEADQSGEEKSPVEPNMNAT